MPHQSSVAHINFGGINTSKLEFVDFSTPQSKRFFQQLQKDWESLQDTIPNPLNGVSSRFGLPLQLATIKGFFNSKLFYHYHSEPLPVQSPSEFDTMIQAASQFMVENLDPEFIRQLRSEDLPTPTTEALRELEMKEPFNLGDVKLNRFVNLILRKDKGIGGLEQLFQDRPSNIGNLNQFLIKNSQSEEYYVDSAKFRQCLYEYYIRGEGLPVEKFQTIKAFKDVFLKGRKEGPNRTNINYYQDVENPLNDENMARFRSLSNLVMMTYDLISLVLINHQGAKVPSNIPEKPSVETVTQQKVDMILRMLQNNPDLSVVFLTECIPECFEPKSDEVFETFQEQMLEYSFHYGPETGGLCNVIITHSRIGEMTPVEVSTEVYPHQGEFKEIPLHLTNSEGNLHLISYHANGKGICVERPVPETSFYSWINGLEGRVVVGCDLNMDYNKHSEQLRDSFELGEFDHAKFTCYKQRTPIQAQWDKAGVFDSKYCDYIITRGFEDSTTTVIRPDRQGNIEHLEDLEVTAQLVIPNNQFPFEHYGVMREVHLPEIKEGFTFFSSISDSLSWIDGFLDRVFGY